MKTKLFYIFVATLIIPCVGLWEGVPVQTGKTTQGVHFESDSSAVSYLPQINFDFSDLDVRDAQNRPIQNTSLTQDLYNLFTQNLFNLTLLTEQHGMRQIWQDIDAISHLLNGLFINLVYPLQQLLQEAMRPSKKRVVHNVDNLWTTFTVGNFLALFIFAFFLTKRPFRIVVLRC